MKTRYLIFIIFSLFQSNCQSIEKESQTSIDIDSSIDTLSLFGKNIISTPLYERDLAIALQGDQLIYTLGDYKQNRRCLVVVNRLNETWGKPEILNISGKYQDIEPFYTNKGNRLFFASNRPIYEDSTRNDYNIWYSDKYEGIWSEPVALDSIINTEKDEFYPSLSKNGNLYFTSIRKNGIGMEDIFISKFKDGSYLLPIALPIEINTPSYEFNAFISPNEDYIIFSSFGRDDGYGGGDLYISKRKQNGNWEKSKNMGQSINSDRLDFCPFVDSESKNFYFTSERLTINNDQINSTTDLHEIANDVNNGFGNIYKVRFNSLK